MTQQPPQSTHGEKLVHAYNRMMERVKAMLEKAGEKTVPKLQHSIDKAKEKAVDLGEVSREEADRIGDYLKRDLEDAGEFLADSGSELHDWFFFDIELIEDRILDLFAAAVDRTRLELLEIEDRAARASQYHTGDITTIGTLECTDCGELLHFHATGHIPPCPRCRNTVFVRAGRVN